MTDSARNRTATDDVFGSVVEHVVASGPAAGTRAIAVAPAGGLHARLLVDRGLDIGAAWVGGYPVAWLSANGERPSGHGDDADGWHDGWAGGLVTTCGLQNVGAASEGHGRHGHYSDLAASEIAVDRRVDRDGTGEIAVSGTMVEPVGLGRGIRVRRRVAFSIGSPVVRIEDEAVNESADALQAPLLYHVNLGHPFLGAETRLLLDGVAAGGEMGPPAAVADEVVEHAAYGSATVESDTLGLRLDIAWDSGTLPRLFTWQRRMRGQYVMAVEPANCSVAGRAADREAGVAPMLEPGAHRRTTLTLAFSQRS